MAITEHGHQIPAGEALRIADHAAIYTLLTNTRNVPLALGRTTRIATPGQTIALAARDRGCAFPGCDRPPAHCQRHHIIEWAHHGETRIDNLVLLCGYHHRTFHQQGWRIVIINGHPWWIPPAWIDPTRQPIRNHAHDYPNTG
jgi:NADH dehydrogenase FAD-containing subunit